jgi:hypothetical protein
MLGVCSSKATQTNTQENVEALRDLQHQLETSLQKRDMDIEELRAHTKKAKLRGETNRSVSIVRMLKRVIALKKSRASIVQHIHTVELQLDALENSEFNQSLLKTIQNSSETMRRMGLDKSLNAADNAMSTLEDSLQTSGEISAALAVPSFDQMNDEDLDAELDSIMGSGGVDAEEALPGTLDMSPCEIPSQTQNSMRDDDELANVSSLVTSRQTTTARIAQSA